MTRKLPLSGGEAVRRQIEAMRQIASQLAQADCTSLQAAARPIGDAIDSLERATQFMLGALAAESPTRRWRVRAPTCAYLRPRRAALCSERRRSRLNAR